MSFNHFDTLSVLYCARLLRRERRDALFVAAADSAQRDVLDRALLSGVSVAQLTGVLDRNPGVPGMTHARSLVRAASDGSAAETERIFAGLLRRAGITGWVVNRPVRTRNGPRRPDFMFSEARVIVELDGWAWHSDPERFSDDRARQNELVLLGWTVLRFTWAQLTSSPDEVIAQVKRALQIC